MPLIDTEFASEIKKYGAADFSACYNCGNCTAVCGLTSKDTVFPRIFIRYGMLGLRDDILQSRELWLCYACGECSETCPRQAAPGDYMAALRRYAIASLEPTGLTKLMFKSKPLFIILTFILAVFLGFFLFTLKPDHIVSRWIFDLIPYAVIHLIGIIIFSITGLSVIWGIISMYMKLNKNKPAGDKKKNSSFMPFIRVIRETMLLERYRTCDAEEESFWKNKHYLVKPWFIHWSVMWGFMGLLAATVLDFMLKDPVTTTWWPARILGTIAGLLLIYGTSMMLYYRKKKITRTYRDTRLADLVFLLFLWIAGITGFWMELSVMLNFAFSLSRFILLIHTIISMELVLLFSFSKFAHAVYRPLALLFHYRGQ